MDILHISIESEFEKVRYIKNKSRVIKLVIDDNIDFKNRFIPIRGLDEYTIIIDGNSHILSNIFIYEYDENNGLFSKVNNLIINDLNISKAYIRGGVLSGVICGEVEHITKINNTNLCDSIISCEAYCGGIVGYSKDLSISNSNIYAEVHGYDVCGGVAGMIDNYLEINCNINCSVIGFGKCLDNKVGYCDRKKINPEKNTKLFKRFHFL